MEPSAPRRQRHGRRSRRRLRLRRHDRRHDVRHLPPRSPVADAARLRAGTRPRAALRVVRRRAGPPRARSADRAWLDLRGVEVLEIPARSARRPRQHQTGGQCTLRVRIRDLDGMPSRKPISHSQSPSTPAPSALMLGRPLTTSARTSSPTSSHSPNTSARAAYQSSHARTSSARAVPPPTPVSTRPRMTSTPVASRRCAVATRTKPESGEVDSHCGARRSRPCPSAGPPAHAGEVPGRVVGEVPVADAIVRLLQAEAERALLVRPRDERERLVQRVAEPGVDVPGPTGCRRGQAGDEDEVVGQLLRARAGRAVHAADVARDGVAERVSRSEARR